MANLRAKIEGDDKVQARFRKMRQRGKIVRLVVGYSTTYAIYVHENLEVFHANGQAKYLEQPARTESRTMTGIIRKAMESGRTLAQSLQLAGVHLLNMSRPLVPVDTGRLKASGFVKIVYEE